jgi:ring-1,2-phenylacetyl-CoA epoxidase subunit PaaE
MTTPKFHTLTIQEVIKETDDTISVVFDVPQNLTSDYAYEAGQYLTLKAQINGEELRRSYSICSEPSSQILKVAIKKQYLGRFSTYAFEHFKAGMAVEVMTPMGNFTQKDADNLQGLHYVFFAVGSGITPIISLIQSILLHQPQHRVTLYYGNRNKSSIVFKETLDALKNKYLSRFSLNYLLTKEYMDAEIFNGRLTKEKVQQLCKVLTPWESIDHVYICGPESMILDIKDEMLQHGLPPSQVHFELFNSGNDMIDQKWVPQDNSVSEDLSDIEIILDGRTTHLKLGYKDMSILDAAIFNGADLPYSCKGGVCCTCRAKLLEGEVEMEKNYALEPDEVEKGYILTCQSHPKTATIRISFDD